MARSIEELRKLNKYEVSAEEIGLINVELLRLGSERAELWRRMEYMRDSSAKVKQYVRLGTEDRALRSEQDRLRRLLPRE